VQAAAAIGAVDARYLQPSWRVDFRRRSVFKHNVSILLALLLLLLLVVVVELLQSS
jgi:hypothetical protein